MLVYKLFIGFRHHTTVIQGLTDPEDDHRRRRTLDPECRAYESAAQDASFHSAVLSKGAKPYSINLYRASAAGTLCLQSCPPLEPVFEASSLPRALDHGRKCVIRQRLC
jgi:hypothetical protein